MYLIGGILTAFGFISVAILGQIFYKYHDMYPWFDGLQPWITGYYLLPVGIYLLSTRWLFVNGIFSYEFDWVESGMLIGAFISLFVVAFGFLYYFKKIMVLAGQIKEDQEKEELADAE